MFFITKHVLTWYIWYTLNPPFFLSQLRWKYRDFGASFLILSIHLTEFDYFLLGGNVKADKNFLHKCQLDTRWFRHRDMPVNHNQQLNIVCTSKHIWVYFCWTIGDASAAGLFALANRRLPLLNKLHTLMPEWTHLTNPTKDQLISENAPFCNRNVHTCVHFYYNISQATFSYPISWIVNFTNICSQGINSMSALA